MKHFTLKELTHTNTGLKNVPNENEISNLEWLVDNVLDPIREAYGNPITVNCAYRSVAVNDKVGGVKNSQHIKGEAADITAGSKAENKKIFDLIVKSKKFDQVINEKNYSWIHVSYTRGRNRRQQLAL